MLDYRIAAVCGAALGAALAARSKYERKSLSVEETEVFSDRLTRDWIFVFLSDLHENEFGPENEQLIAAIDRIKPDGILIGGDLIVTKRDRQEQEYRRPFWPRWLPVIPYTAETAITKAA